VQSCPERSRTARLRDFVAGGKRWFALHGTNAIIKHTGNFRFECPETYPILMQTLGTQFIAHRRSNRSRSASRIRSTSW